MHTKTWITSFIQQNMCRKSSLHQWVMAVCVYIYKKKVFSSSWALFVFTSLEKEHVVLSHRQECSGTVVAYCSLKVLGSSNPPTEYLGLQMCTTMPG